MFALCLRNVGIGCNRAKTQGISSFADMFALANAGEKIVLLDDLRELIGIGYITNSTSVNSTDEVEVQAVAAWSVVVNNFVLQTADIIGLPVCCYVIKTAIFCRSLGDRRPASNRQGHRMADLLEIE